MVLDKDTPWQISAPFSDIRCGVGGRECKPNNSENSSLVRSRVELVVSVCDSGSYVGGDDDTAENGSSEMMTGEMR